LLLVQGRFFHAARLYGNLAAVARKRRFLGTPTGYTPEKLVVGVLSSLPAGDERVTNLLVQELGVIDFCSPAIPFTWTDYYEKEMGSGIVRTFVSFERLVDPACLAQVKIRTNDLEDRFRDSGKRRVNLDPGLMALSRFCLATTKENAHRVPLSAGIYAEITLLHSAGGFRALEWTYPDYRSEAYLSVLNGIRTRYKAQLRST
jgi:hypothetical protein